MKNSLKLVFLIIFIFNSCKNDKNKSQSSDTIITGKTSILVDETLQPIIEDQLAVFENEYDATITIIPNSEKEIILGLTENKSNIAVLSRKLNKEELLFFKQKSIMPIITPFAKDALALIKSSKTNDTLMSVDEIVNFVKGSSSKIKGLVFDNPNSSTVRLICEKAKIKSIPEKLFYSFKTNEEVVKYISENDGFIGIIGVNWISQPNAEIQKYLKKINVLSVNNSKNSTYFYPSQDNIAAGNYPLARDLYIINCQGYDGLGMGLSSFVAGERGQRIILKSGLVPERFPSRNIKIKN